MTTEFRTDGHRSLLRSDLPKQERLLAGVAEATRQLLAIADFDTAVNGALEAIATAADIDRIFVYQNHIEPDFHRESATCPYEWTATDVVKARELPNHFPLFYDEIEGYSEWLSELKTGQPVQKLAREMSGLGQDKQVQEQALSVLTVPIFVEGDYWGNFGFDDCTTERVWDEVEIAVLETAAASFAGALERRKNVAELQRQDALLKSVNEAAQCLVATGELEQAIPEALQILGEETQQDRVYVFENVFPNGPDGVFWEIPYEWVNTGIPTVKVTTTEWPIAMASFPPIVNDSFSTGQAVQFLTRDLQGKAQRINEKGQTLSLLAVPITVSNQWWGVLGFDDCTTERQWSDAEIAVLQTAAACIGGAIERDRTRKDREIAAQTHAAELEAHNLELASRDRILQATASASSALLNGEDFDASVKAALQLLGESIGLDRIAVGQQMSDPTENTSGYIHFLYEWDGLGVISQIQNYEDMTDFHWDAMGLGSWYQACLRGEAFGQVIDELPEPFHSLMQSVDVKSTHNVPIFVEGVFWGVFGIDNCREKRLLSSVELTALKTAANCVGSAIARDRARREREAAAKARAAELAERDRILEASAAAANIMLTEEDFDNAVNRALQIIGVGLAVDRVGLMKHFGAIADTPGYHQQIYEYDAAGISEQINHAELARVSDNGMEFVVEQLVRGEVFGGVVDELPEPFRSGQQELGAQSVYAIPIIVQDHYWGIVALDDCHNETRRSEAELEALRTLANCIGNAIERDNARKEKEAVAQARVAELAERDRILEATAAAANVMLTEEDFDQAVKAALQIVGEGLEVDRINLGQYFEATSPQDVGYHDLSKYEWTSTQTVLQSDHPELSRISNTGMEFLLEELLRGEVFGGIVEELPEPFRSSQLALGVQSTYAVPIRVDGAYWGLIGFDDCHHLTRRSEAELEALITLANCIGNAIERERERQEKEATAAARLTELAERDRILEAIAEAANILLTDVVLDEAIDTALQTIGEAVQTDRVAIIKNIESLTDRSFGQWQLIYEWVSPLTSPITQGDFPELVYGTYEGIDDIYQAHCRGEGFSRLIDEFPEPFRSGQIQLGVQSMHSVPIMQEGHYWGAVTFDDCAEARRRSVAELAVLQTLTDCIGNAIERDRTRKEKEAVAEARVAELAERDRILETTATAANVMLTDENFNTAVHTALAIVGNGLEMDRVLLGQHVDTLLPQEPNHIQFLYEWVAEGTILQTEHPELVKISNEGLELIFETLSRGKIFGGIVDELPEPFRSGQIELGVKSTYSVPVMVEGDYWGVIALDDCHHLTRRSEAELEALRTLANCIANATARDRTRKEKEAAAKARVAELAKRDRILAATAAAANVMLTDEDFDCAVNAALSIVGEGLTVDRIALGKYTEASSPQDVGYHRFLYEWDSDDTSAQLEHSELATITDEGVEQLVAAMKRGEVSGGVVDEMEEPFRSKQKELEVQSTYAVPIRINGQYWGMIGFDDCHAPTRRSEAELEALMTLANCIGSAIERDLTRKEREAAAQAYAAELETHNLALANRDRILEATAAAANVLLTDEDFEDAFNQSLKIIGEAVGTDRVGLAQHLEDLTDTQPGHWRVIHEWCAPQIASVAQIFYPEPMQGTYAGAEQLYRMHQRGEGFSLTTDQMLEPFRSGMAAAGVQTLHAVPIILSDQYWGTVVFGDCRQQRQRSLAELAALQTVADCIGNAIDRDRNRKEREAATQARAVELKKNNEILSLRDRWLSATAAATEKLLSENDLISAVKPALQEIGESIGVDRIGIMYVFEQDSQQVFGFFEEWIHPSQPVQSENEELSAIPCHLIGEQHFKTLLNGQWYGGDIEDFPEPFCSSQKEIGVQSTYSVPIFIDSQFWGLVGIDHCREKKLLTTTEIAVFQTIASCFASAIQRDQIRKAREAAERTALVERERAARAAELEAANQVLTIRDCWLQTTAAAANQLLSTAEISRGVNTALQTLGTNLESDRLGVMRHIPDATELGQFQILYEWDGSGTTCQIDNVELNQMPASDFADWARRLMVGQPAGGLIEEQSEPFRSKMQSLDTLAAYAVPIFIEAEFWGVMFMDYSRELRQLTPAELAVFNTAATCIGSAIHRDQMRRDREQVERDTLLQQEREQAALRRATTLETYNRQLQQRDRLLNSVNAAAQSLVANEDLATALPMMLKILGEGTGQCRAYVLQNSQDEQTGQLLFNLMLEWDAPQIPTKMEVGAHFPVPIDRFPDHLTAPLIAGRATQFLASELDGIKPAERLPGQVLSLVGVPIMVGGKWWGLLGLDDCVEERVWSDTEIAVLETAASAVGSAVECDRSRQARETAEKAVLAEREKAARERAAELAKTNDAIGRALVALTETPELGEFLGQILTQMINQVEACKAHLFLYDEESDTLHQYMAIQDGQVYQGAAPTDPDMFRRPVPSKISSAWEMIVNAPKPFTLDEHHPEAAEAYWPESIPWHQAEGHLSSTCACMKVGGKPIGFIGFAFRHVAVLSDEQLEFIQALTNQATLSIHLTRLAEKAKQAAISQEQEKAAQERVAELAKANEAISKSLTTLAASPELDQFLGTIIEEMARQVGACKVHLFLYDEPTHTLTQRVAVQDGQIYLGVGPNDPEMFSHPIPADITPGWNAIINGEHPVTYDQTQPYDEEIWWPETLGWHKAQGHKAITAIPMKAGDMPIGYIGFCFYDRTILSDEQLEFMQALANQAIVAIQLTRLADEAKQTAILQEQERAARERAVELAKTNEAISKTLDALTTTPELNEFLGQILTQIIEQIGADDTHLFLYDAETHTLRSQLAVQNNTVYLGNAPNDPELFYTGIPANITAAWQILVNAPRPVTLDENNPDSAEFFWPTTLEWHTSRGHQSATCACMKIGNQPIGFIGFAFCDRTVLTNEQLEFVQALTNQATLAIHLTRLAEQARTNALTDERNRLAREIHDTLAQAFTGISLQLEAAKNILSQQPETAKSYLDQARDLTRQGLSEARRSVHALRSQALETESLAKALQKNLTQMTLNTSLQTEFQIQGTPTLLEEGLQLNLLRIGQEAITNALRHAQAQTLTVTLTFTEQQVSLCIVDNGVGFEPQDSADITGFGLVGIHERTARYNGQVQIISQPGKGTTIEVIMPAQPQTYAPNGKVDSRSGG